MGFGGLKYLKFPYFFIRYQMIGFSDLTTFLGCFLGLKQIIIKPMINIMIVYSTLNINICQIQKNPPIRWAQRVKADSPISYLPMKKSSKFHIRYMNKQYPISAIQGVIVHLALLYSKPRQSIYLYIPIPLILYSVLTYYLRLLFILFSLMMRLGILIPLYQCLAQ